MVSREEFLLDDAAIDRILDKVKQAGGTIPDHFYQGSEFPLNDGHGTEVEENRFQFANAIALAFDLEKSFAALSSDAKAKERFEALRRISKALKTILQLLNEHETLVGYFRPIFLSQRNDSDPHPNDVRIVLESLKDDADNLIQALRKSGLSDRALQRDFKKKLPHRDAKEYLIWELVDAYRKFLRAEPKFSYNSSREPAGPYIAFVLAVCEEMNRTWTPGAIRKAYERLYKPSDKDHQKN